MRKIGVFGLLAAIGLMAASEGAYAMAVNCTGSPGALAALFSSGGTANTEYDITGPCNGDFFILEDNIIIHGSGATQTIDGFVAVSANNANLNNLKIIGDANEPAAVLVTGPVTVQIGVSTIQNGPGDGVLADGPALVQISDDTVQNNAEIGLHARGGPRIELSSVNTITGNGGVGILAEQGSTVESAADNTGGDMISQASAPDAPAVVAQGSSHVRLLGSIVAGPSNSHTVFVSQGSSALIEGATIAAGTPFSASNQLAVITVEDTSTAVLAGGNTITNTAAGGLVVIVSAGSTLKENNGTSSGFSAANDSISGDGRIHTQSVIELGALPGATTLTWTGNILLSQASSFVADGGNVTVNGTLTLGQSANGYFNHSAGTSNNISQVKCTSTTDHVANPTLVNPNVTIGSPPGCASF